MTSGNVIALLAAGLLLVSCGPFAIRTPAPKVPHKPPTAEKVDQRERVIVFSHGWHTGIVIPKKALQRHSWTNDLKLDQVTYAEFGWGAEEFYRRPEITLGMVVRGLFWPTPAVVHLERFSDSPYGHYPTSQLVTLELTRNETDRLITELGKSFQMGKNQHLIDLGKGLQEDSSFYRSTFDYYYPNTCNVWTARILQAAGIVVKKSTRSPALIKDLRKCSHAVY